MQLVNHPRHAVDLATTPLHLGLGASAASVEGFDWAPAVLEAYADAVAADGPEGRLVAAFSGDRSWDIWERHPAGDEVVVCLEGRMTLVRELEGGVDAVELGPGQAAVNPAGTWHTADVHEPVRFLTITPGLGTEHRPR